MPYNSRVFRIFIASPSDVEEERDVIAKIITEWNDLHSYEKKIVLLPLRWETHSAPELGRRPQEIINTEIVDHADMAVGVFWTRIGTPTGEYASGTIEEIERLGKANKLVMCYFSKAKAELDNIDLEQYKQLKEFKKKTYPNGLVESYSNIIEFRDKFAKQLELKIRGLIASDISGDGQHLETKPNLSFEFLDPSTKEILGNTYNAKPKIIDSIEKEIELIPDYSKKASKDSIFGINSRYYKDYFEYIKESWRMVPIQFSLKNTSSIAIRDIYIELICPNNSDFEFSSNQRVKPKKSQDYSFDLGTSLASVFGKSTLGLVKSDTTNKIQLGYDALQPQRSVTIEHPLFIYSNKKINIDFNVNIYADCFATPLSHKLKIKIEPHKINKKPLEILEELDIIEK
jgi:hypothetical protein